MFGDTLIINVKNYLNMLKNRESYTKQEITSQIKCVIKHYNFVRNLTSGSIIYFSGQGDNLLIYVIIVIFVNLRNNVLNLNRIGGKFLGSSLIRTTH